MTAITASDYRSLYGIDIDECIECRRPCVPGAARCADCQEWLADVPQMPTPVADAEDSRTSSQDLLHKVLGAREAVGDEHGCWHGAIDDGEDIIASTAAKGFGGDGYDPEMEGAEERLALLLRAIKAEVDSSGFVSVNDIRGYYSHFSRRQMRQVSAWYTSLCSAGVLTRVGREESTDKSGRNAHHPASVFWVNMVLLDDALTNGFTPKTPNRAKTSNRAKTPAAANAKPVVAPVAAEVVDFEQVSLW